MKGSTPQRTCLVCRRRRPQEELLRIARAPEGIVSVDVSHRAEGRGAYVCPDDPECRQAATKRGAISRALRLTLTPDDLARLRAEIEKESVRA